VADELLTRGRVLGFREPLEVFFSDFAAQSPLLGQSSVPFASYLVALCVVVLAGVAELLRVIRLGLACVRGLEMVSTCVGLLEEVPLSRPGPFQRVLAALGYFMWREFLFQRRARSDATAAASGSPFGWITIGRWMYPGCLLGSAMIGKLIRTTRFSVLRYPCRSAIPLISESITNGSIWRSLLWLVVFR